MSEKLEMADSGEPQHSKPTVVRDARGRIVRGTPNPGGRAKSAKLLEQLRPHEKAFVARLVDIAINGRAADALAALKLALAYLYGNPTQPVSGDDEGGPIRVQLEGLRNELLGRLAPSEEPK